MVADALSHRVVPDLRAMFARLSLFDDGSLLAELQVENRKTSDFRLNSEGVLCLHGRVKVEHQLPSRLLQPVKIPLWKWEEVTMDFVSGLPLTPTKKDSFWKKLHEALGARLDLSTAFHPQIDGERRVLWPELVSNTEAKVKLVRDRLKEATDRQKSYADLKH
ncbi:uncharacterized protein LOC128039961 [Gossypium raimondii]|uniref:uncharacterized protein LOC128039961 n=1 Tax=Gossypium raimondii TaxID=29730 RepID=UPI00227BB6A1|nr:uncharacterized protein LOC128039961 [Gossypium raimondii]